MNKIGKTFTIIGCTLGALMGISTIAGGICYAKIPAFQERVDKVFKKEDNTVSILNNDILKLNTEVKTLKGDLATSKSENETLNAELTTSKSQNETLKGELATSKLQNETLQGELETSKSQNETLKSELTASEEKFNTLSVTLANGKIKYISSTNNVASCADGSTTIIGYTNTSDDGSRVKDTIVVYCDNYISNFTNSLSQGQSYIYSEDNYVVTIGDTDSYVSRASSRTNISSDATVTIDYLFDNQVTTRENLFNQLADSTTYNYSISSEPTIDESSNLVTSIRFVIFAGNIF